MPPVYLIGKTMKHFCLLKTGCKAILVCSYWTSATFWPLIVTKFNSLQKFVKDYFIIKDARSYIKLWGLQGILYRLRKLQRILHSIIYGKKGNVGLITLTAI